VRRTRDRLARPLLLAFAKTKFRVHRSQVYANNLHLTNTCTRCTLRGRLLHVMQFCDQRNAISIGAFPC
jgi:hypothetical protein